MQIMLVDNSEKELEVLCNALSKRYENFKNNCKGKKLPDKITIKTMFLDDYCEADIEKYTNDIIRSVGNTPTYFVIDLFLTEKEHAMSYDRADTIENHSGHELAERINEEMPKGGKISLMSKQFPGEKWESGNFERLIEKPIYKGSSDDNPILIEKDILPEPKMCSKLYHLPSELDTIFVLAAFCNIIFYNALC